MGCDTSHDQNGATVVQPQLGNDDYDTSGHQHAPISGQRARRSLIYAGIALVAALVLALVAASALLGARHTVSGIVLNEDGSPAAGCPIAADAIFSAHPVPEYSGVVGADGHFSLHYSAGIYAVTTVCDEGVRHEVNMLTGDAVLNITIAPN